MISLRCASSSSPPCEWRRSRGGVSFGSHGISGFGCLSPGPTRSPVSPLSGNIDSLPGQVALALLLVRDGAHALQFRHVRERPARSLKPLTSHGARARHPRLSQAAMASGAHPAVGAQRASHPQRRGAAARRPPASREPAKRHDSLSRPCGRGCDAQQAGEPRCVAHLRGSAVWLYAGYHEKMTTGTPLYLCMTAQW